MRSWFRMLVVLAALTVPAGTASAAGIVVSAAGPGAAARAAAVAGGRVEAALPQIGAYLVSAPPGSLPQVRSAPGVLAAEPNTSNRLTGLPVTDPLAIGEWYLGRVRAGLAWGETLGEPGVQIAIVDSGVDYASPEVAGRITLGPDFGQGDDDPMDTLGHGTAVASVAGAADDGAGVVGLCPHCGLIAVKVFADGALSTSKFKTAQGIVWAADHGADVINLSLSGPDADIAESDAVAYAQAHGAVVVAAAGNDADPDLQYPAAYPGVIAVASANDLDMLSPTSTFGPWVDLAAPGTEMLAASLHGLYVRADGTSFASPVVAGIAGLLLSRVPGLSPAAVADDLVQGTQPLFETPLRRVDAGRSMRLALGQPLEPEPPVALTFVTFSLERTPARPGRTLTARATVMSSATGQLVREGDMICDGYAGQSRVRLAKADFASSQAICRWSIPETATTRKFHGFFEVVAGGAAAERHFSVPIRRRRP
jgi:subtilisin family serine protease